MKKQKILVTGLNGFIGSRLQAKLRYKYDFRDFIDRHQHKVDITDRKKTFELIAGSEAKIILHLAAKAHIDICEKDRLLRKNSLSWKVNVEGSGNIADACKKFGRQIFYLSTECIFDGLKGNYRETDKPNPINWYGLTKLKGEETVKSSGAKYCILRSTLVFGHPEFHQTDPFHIFKQKIKSGRNVIAVKDQVISLTFIDDLIETMALLLDNKSSGIYHYAGNQNLSPYQFACLIKKILKSKSKIKPVSLTDFFGSKAKFRLRKATLSSDKLTRKFKLKPSELKSVLKKML